MKGHKSKHISSLDSGYRSKCVFLNIKYEIQAPLHFSYFGRVSITEEIHKLSEQSTETESWKHRFPGHVRWECILPGPSRQIFLSLPRSQSLSNNSTQQQNLLCCSQVPPPSSSSLIPACPAAASLLPMQLLGDSGWENDPRWKKKLLEGSLNPAHRLYGQWELEVQ